jgi:selenocysteine-specific elongation factor
MGGGVVLDPLAPARARAWPSDDRAPAALLVRVVEEGGAAGVPLGELPVRLGVAPARGAQLAEAMGGWRVGERLIGRSARGVLVDQALATLAAHHADQPLEPGAPLQWLRSRLRAPEEVSAALLAELGVEGGIVIEQGMARLAGFAPRLSASQDTLRAGLLAALEAAGREPPTIDELSASLGVAAPALGSIARLLAREGVLVAVEPARYYAAPTVAALLAKLREGMQAGVEYGPAELRELLGFSRKFLIPFLEFTDRTGQTLRDASGRRRRGNT